MPRYGERLDKVEKTITRRVSKFREGPGKIAKRKSKIQKREIKLKR